VAAYNAGPGRVGQAGGLPLETLQYVVGVGQYRTLLQMYDAALRRYAMEITLAAVQSGDDWPELSRRLAVPEWELRLYNPFLANRRLRPGQRVAYTMALRADLITPIADGVEYRMRHGDTYFHVASSFGVDLDALRSANALWHIQTVPAGFVLRIPLADDRREALRAAVAGAPASGPPEAVAARVLLHRVARGETLSALARRHGTSIGAIQEANNMGRRTLIHAGQLLRVPARAN